MVRLSFFGLKKIRRRTILVIYGVLFRYRYMLGTLITLVASVLFGTTFIMSLLRFREEKIRKDTRDFLYMYRMVQASTIRQWYPELSDKTLDEIRKAYDVSEAYRELR